MELIEDTPIKRRRLEVGQVAGDHSFNSQEDSGDELFQDHETVATVPLPKANPTPRLPGLASSPAPYVTQPTQLIDRSTPKPDDVSRNPSVVQVMASSPIRSPPVLSMVPTAATSRKTGGILASAMAPPGTTFRLPMGVAKPPTSQVVVNLSDDEGPVYQGSSSEEDSQRTRMANIKPSTFIQRAQRINSAAAGRQPDLTQSSNGLSRFQEITANSFYKPMDGDKNKKQVSSLSGSVFDSRNRDENNRISRISAPLKRSADVMADAYGNSSRPRKQVKQTGPSKATPIEDMSIDDIADSTTRTKIKRIKDVLPGLSIRRCHDALLQKRGHEDDAIELLASQEDERSGVDLTKSDDELDHASRHLSASRSAPAKQQIKAPGRTIQEKWVAPQSFSRSTQPQTTSPRVEAPKPRRRLVKGRKRPSSPIDELAEAVISPPRQTSPILVDDDSDSGIGSEPELDSALDGKLLTFFNTCSVADLADIAEITNKVATTVLSKKPFSNLNEVRQTSTETKPVKPTGKRQNVRKPIGNKIVDKCQEMWAGYDAVDELVKRCEDLRKPVAEEMKKWGVNVFGASKEGELDLVDFNNMKSEDKNDQSSLRDSAIGTPSSTVVSADEEGEADIRKSSDTRSKARQVFFPQPSIMAKGIILKDYQVVGVNWLSLLYEKGLSCILADDMGLGKTCQVIAFLAHLLEKGITGPHLVVVPGSTLENWLREFSVFCPQLMVMPYYAGQKERLEVRDQIEANLQNINVIITTYGVAKIKDDNKFLRHLKPKVCVYDEGHILKNSKSAGYDQLMRIPATFRLLLTGTPLQNNLRELASLLGFILPSVFKQHAEDLEFVFNHKAKTSDETHATLLSAQRIARARSMMTPFILRRKKHQVLKHLPTKTRRIEYCSLTASQSEIYVGREAQARRILADREAGKKTGSETTHIMTDLRKASIHPLLFRRKYDDTVISKMSKECLAEDEFSSSNVDLVYEDMSVMTDFELHTFCERYPKTMAKYSLKNSEWMDSGKVAVLSELLLAFKATGDRVLIFSQFVMVMNVLEAVMETLNMRFFRLDGATKIEERQDMIDQFYDDESITAFLLSTKAGGAGINLACANKVVIFDSSFNPQDDIQAENRAHRVGQKREVEVIRLVTKGTIEESIHALGETKLALDARVAGDGAVAEEDEAKAEKAGAKKVEDIMMKRIMAEGGTKESRS